MTILGSYALTVAPGPWTLGPIVRPGETVRVRAGGVVRWGGDRLVSDDTLSVDSASTGWTDLGVVVPEGCYAVVNVSGVVSRGGSPGYPEGYYENDTSGGTHPYDPATVVDHADPAWPDGYACMNCRAQSLALAARVAPLIPAIGISDGLQPDRGPTVFPSSTVAGKRLWAIVNDRQGFYFDNSGAFAVRIRVYEPRSPGQTDPAPATRYAYPEGTYPPDFAAIGYAASYAPAYPQGYDPNAVLRPEDWTGEPLLAPGLPPLSLVARAFPDGFVPPLAPTLGCAFIGRARTLSPEEMIQAGAAENGPAHRLWFAIDDSVAGLASDTGFYTVLVDRLATPITMRLPLTSLEKPRFGLQTQEGQQAPVTRLLGCIADNGFKIKPDITEEDYGTAGFGYQTGSVITFDVSSGDVTLNLDTEDSGYVVTSVFGSETVVTVAPGVYDHVFTYSAFTQAVSQRLSLELVTESDEMAQATKDLIFNGLKIGTSPEKLPTASSTFMAGKLLNTGEDDMPTLTTGHNDVQLVTLTGGATGGSFALVDDAFVTGAIAYNAAASDVQTAIRLLANYSSATVAGSAGGPWTITNPTGRRMKKLEAIFTGAGGDSTLTGGTTPAVVVSQPTPGGFAITPGVRCGSNWCLKIATDWTAMENAPVSLDNHWSADLTIAERYARKQLGGCAPNLFTYYQKEGKDISDTLSIEMAFVDQVRTFIKARRSNTRLCTRLQSTGVPIGNTGYSSFFRIDMDGQAKWPDMSDSTNVRSIKIDLRALYNLANGQMLRVVIRNGRSTPYTTF